ncbi:MAG: helix-turn-helix domain-containing protein, partial [Nanoarchaeota archaeon]|nr:helix-turn-helix domain-containing protein [Nanoarchaeota archaeon]
AILSINDGVEVNAVCVVLDVTREAVRQWRVNLEASGLNGLVLVHRESDFFIQKNANFLMGICPKFRGLFMHKKKLKIVIVLSNL